MNMEVIQPEKRAYLRNGERGFTLPEVLTTIVVMGILFAIASSTWFSVIESRRVESATNQLTADLRLAHTNATNRLSTWGVVLVPDRSAENVGPDYYLVKFDSSGNVVASGTVPRILPGNTKVMNVTDLVLNDNPTLLGLGTSRTIKFSPNGSAEGPATGVTGADTIEVTNDGSPKGEITFVGTTSRIKARVAD
jgi:prepilin-type N-terminal cleavage/methylation domain-containing protein